MKNQALWMRLREVEWQNYSVSQGGADRLPKLLQDLASRKNSRAMRASHELWQLLCRGGVRSGAVVVVPFLVEILKISDTQVQCEIADLLKSMAVGSDVLEAGEQQRLQEVLGAQSAVLQKVRVRGDAVIAIASAIEAIKAF